jgi:hypothetical protein
VNAMISQSLPKHIIPSNELRIRLLFENQY